MWTGMMAEQVKMPPVNANDQGMRTRYYIVEGENRLPQVIL